MAGSRVLRFGSGLVLGLPLVLFGCDLPLAPLEDYGVEVADAGHAADARPVVDAASGGADAAAAPGPDGGVATRDATPPGRDGASVPADAAADARARADGRVAPPPPDAAPGPVDAAGDGGPDAAGADATPRADAAVDAGPADERVCCDAPDGRALLAPDACPERQRLSRSVCAPIAEVCCETDGVFGRLAPELCPSGRRFPDAYCALPANFEVCCLPPQGALAVSALALCLPEWLAPDDACMPGPSNACCTPRAPRWRAAVDCAAPAPEGACGDAPELVCCGRTGQAPVVEGAATCAPAWRLPAWSCGAGEPPAGPACCRTEEGVARVAAAACAAGARRPDAECDVIAPPRCCAAEVAGDEPGLRPGNLCAAPLAAEACGPLLCCGAPPGEQAAAACGPNDSPAYACNAELDPPVCCAGAGGILEVRVESRCPVADRRVPEDCRPEAGPEICCLDRYGTRPVLRGAALCPLLGEPVDGALCEPTPHPPVCCAAGAGQRPLWRPAEACPAGETRAEADCVAGVVDLGVCCAVGCGVSRAQSAGHCAALLGTPVEPDRCDLAAGLICCDTAAGPALSGADRCLHPLDEAACAPRVFRFDATWVPESESTGATEASPGVPLAVVFEAPLRRALGFPAADAPPGLYGAAGAAAGACGLRIELGPARAHFVGESGGRSLDVGFAEPGVPTALFLGARAGGGMAYRMQGARWSLPAPGRTGALMLGAEQDELGWGGTYQAAPSADAWPVLPNASVNAVPLTVSVVGLSGPLLHAVGRAEVVFSTAPPR